ncbi:hypothetical protein K6V18_06625 [Ralstonia insidiosa]|uniref:hypothetical protein n=1 Tax=Ralstonia TaxID=48736 RepID=UPI00066AD509|nr:MULTISPECIES: hypothetical protein [Ralstonia]MBY4704677.1 hypothetical protein [Ralstonia insidiosa]GAQ30425.1 hypothetical protein SAMD00023378_4108 [Ralstonia sp. NT80]
MKEKLQQLKKIAMRSALVAGAVSAVEARAAATPPDFTQLTSGIDFSTVVVGVLAVAATLITVYVAIKGAKIITHMVRGA